MNLTIYTDGGSLNNPGEAAIAYVIYLEEKEVVRHGQEIGIASNNFAEYTALIKALTKVKELVASGELKDTHKINVFSDSELMVNQLNGLYKVKNGDIRENLFKIRILEQELNLPIVYTHVLREKNQLADSLVKKALGR